MLPDLANLSPRPRARSASLVLALLALVANGCSHSLTTALDPNQVPQAAGRGRGTPLAAPAAMVSASQTLNAIDDQFVVTLEPGTDAARVAADYGAILLDVQQNFALMQRPPVEASDLMDVAVRIRTDTHVVCTEENTLALPAEARQKSWAFDDGHGSIRAALGQSVLAHLGLTAAQAVSQGQGVLVAVLDTGIDPSHPMFAGRIAGGMDFVDDDSDPTDVANGIDEDGDGVADGAYGHGTHVAGIVAMTAPRARLLIVRVLDAEGRGDVKTVAAGIRWAVGHGARVINLSLGMMRSSGAINIALSEARAQGVICVAAVGNNGTESPREYPAASNYTLAVAAVDGHDQPASFTSYGTYVDLCAPGVDIRSAYPGGRYVLWSGTSMATPFVSGAAALLLSLHPTWTMSDVIGRLAAFARSPVSATAAQAGRLGGGALNVRAALDDDRAASESVDRLYSSTSLAPAP